MGHHERASRLTVQFHAGHLKYFGVKLSIDGKIVAKARATSKKKAEEIASKRAYFVFQTKIDSK